MVFQPIRRLLVANRGEILARVLRTARSLGIETVAIFSPVDRGMRALALADQAIEVSSYLDVDSVLQAVSVSGADAVHPGYGFLSERPDFAAALAAAGVRFVGPSVDSMRAMSSKADARREMAALGLPVLPGYDGEDQRPEAFLAAATRIGFPLMVKASAGGGGKGMSVVWSEGELAAAVEGAQRLSASAFGDARLILERYVQRPRHVEVQVIGDTAGGLLHLWERECSVQRRHQKVIEEAPSPAFVGRPEARAALLSDAVAAARAVGYHSAGTVEFIVDEAGQHYFLEMNTRLQVEHPVTEHITGLDLVALQLAVAEGRPLPLQQAEVPCRGWSMEARVYAEDPAQGYLPSAGPLLAFALPAPVGGRVDAALTAGEAVVPDYDPMLAKVISAGADREAARRGLLAALRGARVAGVATNLPQLCAVLDCGPFTAGELHTGLLEDPALSGAVGREAVVHDALIVGCVLEACAAAAAAPLAGRLPVAFRTNPWPEPPMRFGVAGRVARLPVRWSGQLGEIGGPRGLPSEGAAPEPADPAFPEAVAVELLERQGETLRLRVGQGPGARLLNAQVVEQGDVLHVILAGGTVPLRRLPLRDPPARASGGAGAIAPMPGRVVRLLVEEGAEVAAGDGLVVIEAMKMEQVVRTAEAGLARLLVAVGDAVRAGQPLARVERTAAG